ncbi:hypothetical protein HPB51_023057 [Rhipicephalus microplus]|uniref:THAP-type domain-containing protein n=1 Tax=Rhipicephalus microplus TaxID=6941 RepID=A0A9J6DJB3_RHIMP|nr:hypothetical protein HPB51_023057 [Rhipicephalus microplus]
MRAQATLSARVWQLATRRQLCEKHFLASDYVKTSKYTDMKTGKNIKVPLKVFQLKPDAIPSVFTNCPQYLSRQNACTWEAQEEKTKRLEDESLHIIVEKSLEEKRQQEKHNQVTSFSEFRNALRPTQHDVARRACVWWFREKCEKPEADSVEIVQAVAVVEAVQDPQLEEAELASSCDKCVVAWMICAASSSKLPWQHLAVAVDYVVIAAVNTVAMSWIVDMRSARSLGAQFDSVAAFASWTATTSFPGRLRVDVAASATVSDVVEMVNGG